MNAEHACSLVLIIFCQIDRVDKGHLSRTFTEIPQTGPVRAYLLRGHAAQEQRKVLNPNRVFRQVHGIENSLQDVRKLPDIPGPRISLE